MLFRILTEDLNRDKITDAAGKCGFVAFTLIPSFGYWNGTPERSLTVEIDAPPSPQVAARVRELAREIKGFNRQEAVLVQEILVSVSELEVMAASPSKQEINNALRKLQRKNPGTEYVVLRASNGEVAIVTRQYLEQS